MSSDRIRLIRVWRLLERLSLRALHVLADLCHHLMIWIARSKNVLISLSNLLSFWWITLHESQRWRRTNRTDTSSQTQIKLFVNLWRVIVLKFHFFIFRTYILILNRMICMKPSLIQIKIADSQRALLIRLLRWFLFLNFHKFV